MILSIFQTLSKLDPLRDWKRIESILRWSGNILLSSSRSLFYLPLSSFDNINIKNNLNNINDNNNINNNINNINNINNNDNNINNNRKEDENQLTNSEILLRSILLCVDHPYEHISKLSFNYLKLIKEKNEKTFFQIVKKSFHLLIEKSSSTILPSISDHLKLSFLKLIFSHLKIVDEKMIQNLIQFSMIDLSYSLFYLLQFNLNSSFYTSNYHINIFDPVFHSSNPFHYKNINLNNQNINSNINLNNINNNNLNNNINNINLNNENINNSFEYDPLRLYFERENKKRSNALLYLSSSSNQL